MRSARWRLILGPPFVVAAAAALLGGPPVTRPSPADRVAPVELAASDVALPVCIDRGPIETPRALAASAWFRVDPVLDGGGGLVGQRLEAGRLGTPRFLVLDLEAEAFVSGPTGGRLVVGSDDGRRSLVRIVDVLAGCASVVYLGPMLVRRAVLTPDGEATVEFRLDRRTRADLGIWRRSIDDDTETALATPLPPNERLGRIFATELSFAGDGRLFVASCGESACLTRVIDPASGATRTVDDPHVGEPIGLVGEELIAYGPCPALPCPIVAVGLEGDRPKTLAGLAGLANLASGRAAPIVAYEDYRSGGAAAAVGLDGQPMSLPPIANDLRLVSAAGRAAAGIELPEGWLAFGRGGRPGGTGTADAVFVRLADGGRVSAAEVAP